MDKRQLRTRARLWSAVIDLAATRDPAALSVTELAAAALVNRSTFYQHAATPMDVFIGALRADLEALRADGYSVAGVEPDMATLALRAAQLIDARQAFRRDLLDESGRTVHYELSTFIADELDRATQARLPEVTRNGIPRTCHVAAISAALVAAIKAWLLLPAGHRAPCALHGLCASLLEQFGRQGPASPGRQERQWS